MSLQAKSKLVDMSPHSSHGNFQLTTTEVSKKAFLQKIVAQSKQPFCSSLYMYKSYLVRFIALGQTGGC